MSGPVHTPVAAVLLLWATALGGQEQAAPTEDGGVEASPIALSRVIERGLDQIEGPFRLRVDCTDRRGFRSLELFESGVAIWNGRAQLALPVPTRRSLLEILLHDGFVSFAPRYGGRPEPDDPQAALRISCRVELEIGGLRKSSIQLAEGEQSAALAALAAGLLDLAEPLGEVGTIADDLADGLRKLASGELAPEGFELRLVQLPAAGQEQPGAILRVRSSTLSRQVYRPGRELGEEQAEDLTPARFAEIVKALREARVWTLPVNLWSESHLELEVRILLHHRSVIARPFSRLSREGLGEAQQRFDRLLVDLGRVQSSEPRRGERDVGQGPGAPVLRLW